MKTSSPKQRNDVVIILPAYNAEMTLSKTLKDIPKQYSKNIILVDDGSTDNTVNIAKKHKIKVFSHLHNLGYGGNQKTCYWETLKKNFSVVVMLHPDYQYDAKRLPKLIDPITRGEYDIMIGSRIRTREEALSGGMPKIKYFLNRILTTIENIVLGVNLSEHLSGFRAYSRKVLFTVPFQRFSNDFVFDQQFLISAISFNFKIGETPVPVRYFSEASSIGYLKGIKFLLETGKCLITFILHKTGLILSPLFKKLDA
jgi:glycosyltransferase involved in cell wall biosynthesis